MGDIQLSRRDFEKPAITLGRITLILFGVGLILGSLGLMVIWGYSWSTGGSSLTGSYTTIIVVNIVADAFLLLAGVFVLRVAMRLSKGIVAAIATFVAVVMSGVYLLLIGVVGVYLYSISSNSVSLRNNGILLIVSAVLLIVGTGIYLRGSITGKIAGAIMAMTSIGLAIAGSQSAGTAGGSLVYFGLQTVIGGAIGPIDTGALGQSALIIAAIAALMYPILSKSRFVLVSYIIAAVAFIVLGIGYIIPTMSFLFGPIWQSSNTVLTWASVYITANVILAVTGYLIVASGAFGVGLFSMSLASQVSFVSKENVQAPSVPIPETTTPPVVPPSPAEAAPASMVYCTKCGAALKPDAVYCRRCGTQVT